MPQAIGRLLATPNTTPRLPAINLPPSAIGLALERKALYRAATAGPEGISPQRIEANRRGDWRLVFIPPGKANCGESLLAALPLFGGGPARIARAEWREALALGLQVNPRVMAHERLAGRTGYAGIRHVIHFNPRATRSRRARGTRRPRSAADRRRGRAHRCRGGTLRLRRPPRPPPPCS